MFSRSIYCFMCTFVAAAIATSYNGQDSNTGSVTGIPVHQLRIRNLRSSAPGDHQTSAPATPTVPAQTITPTVDDYISLLRRLSPEEKNSRLISAASMELVGELEALLAAGADVGAEDERGMTALYWAAKEGNQEATRRLLAAGASVDARDRLVKLTPLQRAALSGHTAVVRLLLAAGADHSARDVAYGWTPLHWAACTGRTETAAALLQAGADRGARDREGKTPLDIARQWNDQQVVELLQGDSGLTASTAPQ